MPIIFVYLKLIFWGLWGLTVCAFPMQSMAQKMRVPSLHKITSHKFAVTTVNLNTADLATLQTLKGLGPKKSQAIVAYRQSHGAFSSVNDLSQVKGIGDKSLLRLKQSNPGRLIAIGPGEL